MPGHLDLEFDHVTKDYAYTGHAVLMGLHSVFYRTLLSKKKSFIKIKNKLILAFQSPIQARPGLLTPQSFFVRLGALSCTQAQDPSENLIRLLLGSTLSGFRTVLTGSVWSSPHLSALSSFLATCPLAFHTPVRLLPRVPGGPEAPHPKSMHTLLLHLEHVSSQPPPDCRLPITMSVQFSSVQLFSHVQLFETHGPKHARPPCPPPTPRVYSNSCPLSQ